MTVRPPRRAPTRRLKRAALGDDDRAAFRARVERDVVAAGRTHDATPFCCVNAARAANLHCAQFFVLTRGVKSRLSSRAISKAVEKGPRATYEVARGPYGLPEQPSRSHTNPPDDCDTI